MLVGGGVVVGDAAVRQPTQATAHSVQRKSSLLMPAVQRLVVVACYPGPYNAMLAARPMMGTMKSFLSMLCIHLIKYCSHRAYEVCMRASIEVRDRV